jgi:hypothetical protein
MNLLFHKRRRISLLAERTVSVSRRDRLYGVIVIIWPIIIIVIIIIIIKISSWSQTHGKRTDRNINQNLQSSNEKQKLLPPCLLPQILMIKWLATVHLYVDCYETTRLASLAALLIFSGHNGQ